MTPNKKSHLENLKGYIDTCEKFLEVNKERYYEEVSINQDAIKTIKALRKDKKTWLFMIVKIIVIIKNLDLFFLRMIKPKKRIAVLEEYWYSKEQIREYNEVRNDFIELRDEYNKKLRKKYEVE
tara:strand:+ start:2480 stop:2851 length:372 start_codon:yes stop_codon:yes gene_type:complete